MYILLIIATMLFASQFILSQKFQQEMGSDSMATAIFGAYTNLFSFMLMLILNKFQIKVTPFAMGMASLYSVTCILNTYCALKAFGSANLSVFSIFSMLGGMLLPFIYGTAVGGEELTVFKVLCCIIIFAALCFTFEKGHSSKKAYVYYFGIFTLNGLVGVWSAIHQSNQELCTDSRSFLAIANAISFVICFVWQFIQSKGTVKLTKKCIACTACYALCCGTGNLLLLIALKTLPASVQYPIVTGGVMFFSTSVSLVRREKVSAKNIVSAVLAVISTVLIIL